MNQTMTARELIEIWAGRLAVEQERIAAAKLDEPIPCLTGRLLRAIGTLYVYELKLPAGRSLEVDTPLSIVPADALDPAEGLVLSCQGETAVVQTTDSLGQHFEEATIVPDRAGLLATSAARLTEMLSHPDSYRLGAADRLATVLASSRVDGSGGSGTSILTGVWSEDLSIRHQKIAATAIELIRSNKRILLICPDHRTADEVSGVIARAMKVGGLMYKTWISRYEVTLAQQAAGISIHELGFEAQMHQFYAKSRADKATLRKKYERFRELTPILAYKGHKQKDLDEVRLLEWRLLTQLSDLQGKSKEAQSTLDEYESLPLLRRLSMQAVGKNVASLHQYLALYENQIAGLMKELAIAKARIDKLVPEAAVPKDMRPEFEDLKEEIIRLGGTKKIRELLAAEENTNRQAFIQNRRLVITTAARVLSDPLFRRVRFDVLIAENAPWIPAAGLLGAAGLVHERIVLTGNQRDISTAGFWNSTEMAAESLR